MNLADDLTHVSDNMKELVEKMKTIGVKKLGEAVNYLWWAHEIQFLQLLHSTDKLIDHFYEKEL
jgi:hypothetical protein